MHWSRVAANAGATNWHGCARQDGWLLSCAGIWWRLEPGTVLGLEVMILLPNGGLAASPRVRYTLETAEECLSIASTFTDVRETMITGLERLIIWPTGLTAHAYW